MDNERQYYKIKVPNPNSSITHALDVGIGITEKRYSLNGKYVIIKTTQLRIKSKTDSGVDFNVIFPPGLTTELTYEEAFALMRTEDWQIISEI